MQIYIYTAGISQTGNRVSIDEPSGTGDIEAWQGAVLLRCMGSNIKSVRNAIRSGFRPAWVEMTAKSVEFVKDMNK